MNSYTLAGAVLLAVWWLRRSAGTPDGQPDKAPGVVVNSNIVKEDRAAQSLAELAAALSADPNRYTNFNFLGQGIDFDFRSAPMIERRAGIPGQPQILIP